MRTVIVTRPRGQAATWVAALAERGVPAAALPLIEIALAADAAPLRAAWQALDRHALVVFVSPNAVEAFFAARGEAAWPQGVRAGSTGPGTSAALRAQGVDAQAIDEPGADAASFDSEALWTRIAARDWHGTSVLIVRGDGGRDWLATTLAAHGAQVSFLAAYARRAPALDVAERKLLEACLADPAAHVLWFSSSEAIANLRALMPQADWQGCAAWASHPRIVERAREAGFGRVDLVGPTIEAALAALARDRDSGRYTPSS